MTRWRKLSFSVFCFAELAYWADRFPQIVMGLYLLPEWADAIYKETSWFLTIQYPVLLTVAYFYARSRWQTGQSVKGVGS